jgi:membrane-bound inhibitor of C-type lysozyme
MIKAFFLIALSAVILAGCTSFQLNLPRSFSCDNGMSIRAYDIAPSEQNAHRRGAAVSIDGKMRDMYRISSASGVKYGTENGLDDMSGLIWWEKGDEAILYQMILDHTASADNYPVLARCQKR